MSQTFYLENDPSTPSLNETIPLPKPTTSLAIEVDGFVGGATSADDEKYHAAACYVSAINATNNVQNALSKIMTLPHWAATKNLKIFPAAGTMWNAFYDRNSLKFFYDTHPTTRKRVYLADSVDIVTHELGHAFLDTLRPDFWSTPAAEIRAFHEAFADIVAVFSAMQHDSILKSALEETNGDLMKSNVISRLAEQVGGILYAVSNRASGYPNCLRDAVNNFYYQNPNTLPNDADNASILISECHSFGQVFLGAWYEAMIACFNLLPKGNDPITSLKQARDVSFLYLLDSTRAAPRCVSFTKAAAEGMLTSAKCRNDGAYVDVLREVFVRRRVIAADAFSALSNKRVRALADVKQCMHKNDNEFQDMNVIRYNRKRTIKISNFAVSMLGQEDNPFFDVEIEVPNDSLFEFDKNETIVREIQPDEQEIIQSTINAAISIWHEDKKEEQANRAWQVRDGKLIRKLIY